MKKLATTILGALLFCFASFAQDIDLDELLDNYFEVTGVEKIKDVKTMVMSGKSMTMGMETPIKIITKRPGKSRMEMEIQGQKMVNCFDGEKGWAIRPWISKEPVDFNEMEIEQSKINADIEGPLYNYKEKGHTLEFIGTEEMEGTEVYVVKLTHKDGPVFHYYFDTEEFILLKQKFSDDINGNKVETSTLFSNYKEVDGMLMPFAITTQVNPQVKSQMVIEEIKINENIDDSIFKKPTAN